MAQAQNQGIKFLFSVGFFAPIDVVFLVLVALGGVASLTCFVLGSNFSGITCLVTVAICLQMWIIILAFRSMWFSLQTLNKSTNLAPDAARLAVQFMTGNSSTVPEEER
jgi:protein-S-isoprenylcysteine O-methyltransferase Ste14